jgi:hypothetical protein
MLSKDVLGVNLLLHVKIKTALVVHLSAILAQIVKAMNFADHVWMNRVVLGVRKLMQNQDVNPLPLPHVPRLLLALPFVSNSVNVHCVTNSADVRGVMIMEACALI